MVHIIRYKNHFVIEAMFCSKTFFDTDEFLIQFIVWSTPFLNQVIQVNFWPLLIQSIIWTKRYSDPHFLLQPIFTVSPRLRHDIHCPQSFFWFRPFGAASHFLHRNSSAVVQFSGVSAAMNSEYSQSRIDRESCQNLWILEYAGYATRVQNRPIHIPALRRSQMVYTMSDGTPCVIYNNINNKIIFTEVVSVLYKHSYLSVSIYLTTFFYMIIELSFLMK